MRPGLWWRQCRRAQRLSGVQRLNRSTDGLYSHPIPNLSWDQAFLLNKAPSISKLSSVRVFFFLLLLFIPKSTAGFCSLSKESNYESSFIFLLLLSFEKTTVDALKYALNLLVIILCECDLIFHFWLRKSTSVLSAVGCNTVFIIKCHMQIVFSVLTSLQG